MDYNVKAFEIVKRSINSAVFIDEKAKEFYSEGPVNKDIIEEELSVGLFNGFKSEGISLAIHKFKKDDTSNEKLIQYLLKDRDLVLLDWELDDIDGIEYSLELLSKVVRYPHINFCCIYSSTKRFDDISKHINSYFSGFTNDDSGKVVSQYSYIDPSEFLEPAIILLNENIEDKIKDFLASEEIEMESFPVKCESYADVLKILIFSFSNLKKSNLREAKITSTSEESHSFIINNTFVFVLKKEVETDVTPSILIRRIANELVKNKNSFIQLLGLEMQTIFNENESFINENMFQSSTEALFSHRNHLKAKNKNDILFNAMIKKVLIEHATLRLRTSKLSLLETSFLDIESVKYNSTPSHEEIASMNTFYNSVTIKDLSDKGSTNVDFGDIFIDNNSNYYLCITALCDCLNPDKIKQNYFFVKGTKLSTDIANTLGDSAFISFIPGNMAVSWVSLEKTNISPGKQENDFYALPKKIQKQIDKIGDVRIKNELSKRLNGLFAEKVKDISNLKTENEELKQFKYKPVYIKPHIYNIKTPQIIDDTIELRRIQSAPMEETEQDSGSLEIFCVKYVTTLRPDYTQRIANHTFSHSVRVGVDFIPKK